MCSFANSGGRKSAVRPPSSGSISCVTLLNFTPHVPSAVDLDSQGPNSLIAFVVRRLQIIENG